jgi:hypothetical protein
VPKLNQEVLSVRTERSLYKRYLLELGRYFYFVPGIAKSRSQEREVMVWTQMPTH